MSLPPELQFLAPFFVPLSESLRSKDWLLSDFEANRWEYSFGFKEPKWLDWNVMLDDGSSLIERKNKELLDGLKYFLAGSTQDNSNSNSLVARSLEFARAIHIVDFLLLNSKHFKIAKHGLAGLGRDSLKSILSQIGSSNDTAEGVYGWSKRLSLHCLTLASEVDKTAVDNAITDWPELGTLTPDQIDENTLDIPISLIPQVRAALHLKDLYIIRQGKGHVPNSIKLSNEIYRNTLKGRNDDKPVIGVLAVAASNDFICEHPPIPVVTGANPMMSEANFHSYKKTLYSLGNLHDIGLPAPSKEDLISAKNFTTTSTPPGRFRTLPSEVVFGAVRRSVEFHIQHGTEIVNAFCRAALYCKRKKLSFSEVTDSRFQAIFGHHLTTLGVKSLGLTRQVVGLPRRGVRKGSKEVYFTKLRANHGLIELVKILIACTQIIVGSLMGRRIGELLDLHAKDCLDASQQWLIFYNRKSTYQVYGTRQMEARPIEPIAVKMICNLVRMQKILKRIGFIKELQPLFASPSSQGSMKLSDVASYNFNHNLNLFCDYFETQTDESGRRHYIRQHQLRRFFAMLFFYSSSFGGLETLQWMLGHTDPQHIWHYITESMDGATLRGAKAQFVAEALHSGDVASFENLAALMKARYGTEDFTIVDTEELEDYLSDLMEEGSVEIEPEFIEDDEGQRFKVVARVKQVAA